eukprot:3496326-Rhodomonas_salina.9
MVLRICYAASASQELLKSSASTGPYWHSVWCYALSSTAMPHAAISLRACYAMSGTETAYAAARCPEPTRLAVLSEGGRGQERGRERARKERGQGGGRLRARYVPTLCCYAMSGTDIAYAISPYAVCSTELAYAATQVLHAAGERLVEVEEAMAIGYAPTRVLRDVRLCRMVVCMCYELSGTGIGHSDLGMPVLAYGVPTRCPVLTYAMSGTDPRAPVQIRAYDRARPTVRASRGHVTRRQ